MIPRISRKMLDYVSLHTPSWGLVLLSIHLTMYAGRPRQSGPVPFVFLVFLVHMSRRAWLRTYFAALQTP